LRQRRRRHRAAAGPGPLSPLRRSCAPPRASAGPLGNDRFLAGIERATGRALKPGERGSTPASPEKRR
jgi:hypothetical protein